MINLFIVVNTLSNVTNTTQFDNFTIEWENFNLFNCAVPTSVNISLFTCIPAAYTQVNDTDCLVETSTTFDENTCPSYVTTAVYATSTQQTTGSITTMVTTTGGVQVNKDMRFFASELQNKIPT